MGLYIGVILLMKQFYRRVTNSGYSISDIALYVI